MKSTILPFIVCSFILISCQSKKHSRYVTLEKTEEKVIFPVNANSSLFIKALFIFTDKEGKSYLTYLNNDEPEIYIYDIKTQELIKTIRYAKEGPDGIGPKAGGYFMKDWNEIYLPNLYTPEISVIDSAGHKLRGIEYYKFDVDYPFIPTRSVSFNPIIYQNGKLYCPQLVNPRLGEKAIESSPVELSLDLNTQKIEILPMKYPSTVTGKYTLPSLGIETKVSRCSNGELFVYSFSFDENIYVADFDHKEIRKIKAKSAYIDKVNLPENVPTDFHLAVRKMCELPFYGNIIYDKYRDVYYRFVYPAAEFDEPENFADLWQFGRKGFSILILDKQFQVIGETLFPDNEYVSTLLYIDKAGLFICDNHYKNTGFNENILSFRCFKLNQK